MPLMTSQAWNSAGLIIANTDPRSIILLDIAGSVLHGPSALAYIACVGIDAALVLCYSHLTLTITNQHSFTEYLSSSFFIADNQSYILP